MAQRTNRNILEMFKAWSQPGHNFILFQAVPSIRDDERIFLYIKLGVGVGEGGGGGGGGGVILFYTCINRSRLFKLGS